MLEALFPPGWSTLKKLMWLLLTGAGGAGWKWTTVTGNPVTLSNAVAGPLRQLKIEFSPVQEGSGDPSPENERPISGWTGVNVWQRGKNLFHIGDAPIDETKNGCTFEINGASGHLSGTSTIEGGTLPTNYTAYHYVELPAGTYTISSTSFANSGCYLRTRWDSAAGSSFISETGAPNGYTFTLTTTRKLYITVGVYGTASVGYFKENVDFDFEIQIELGNAKTDFVPYDPASQVIHVAFPAVGVNQWDEEYEEGIYNTSGEKESRSGYNRTKNRISVIPSAAYYVQQAIAEHGVFCTYDENGVFNHRLTSSDVLNGVLTIPADAYYLVFACSQSYWTSSTKVFINYPATETSYVPFDGTRYSGWVDPTTGDGIVDMAAVDMGTLSWNYSASGDPFFYATVQDIKRPADWGAIPNWVCSSYKTISGNAVSGGTVGIGGNPNLSQIRLCDPTYTDKDTFETAMSGVTLCYELAEPIQFHVDPQSISPLEGDNTMWADVNGDITLEYMADREVDDVEALSMLLGGRYTPATGPEDVSDAEALSIITGGNR